MFSTRRVLVIMLALCLFVLQACSSAAVPTQPLQQQIPLAPSSVPSLTPALPTITVAEPTSTPEPTNTLVPPTASPTRTEVPPTVTATVTPVKSGEIVSDSAGQYSVVSEKGEKMVVPAIAGLKQEEQAINGVSTVIYKAEKTNLYGLKEGAFAGLYNPGVYVIIAQDSEQVGSVGLRTEVVGPLLKQAGFPEVVFPLPFDLTGDLKDEVTMQFLKDPSGNSNLFMHVPQSAVLLSPAPAETLFHFAPQPQNNANLNVVGPMFNGSYSLLIRTPEQTTKFVDHTLHFGDPVKGYTIGDSFSQKYLNFLTPSFGNF